MSQVYDVIIIGAGASGLSCADQLLQAGKKILVLEARSFVGGRAHSVLSGYGPVDLGAEFIHGYPKSTIQYVQDFKLNFYDVEDSRYSFRNGKLSKSAQFWKLMQKYTDQMEKIKDKDQSVQDFLRKKKESYSLKLFKSFIEGFHAADLELIGRKGFLSAAEVEESDLNGTEMFRLSEGYSNLWETLLQNKREISSVIRLSMKVQGIDYSKSILTLKAKSHPGKSEISEFKAKKIVVSVPLGVLKSSNPEDGAIQWFPEVPPELNSFLNSVEMGHVQKMTFEFKTRFWEGLKEEKMSFMHDDPKTYFPTWWNFLPVRNPLLVAWQGGPKALEMSSWSQERLVEKAFETLARLTRKKSSFLYEQLNQVYYHNWSKDPFALGAYSYIRTNGLAGSKSLRNGINRKIYFAGEATESGSGRGTVHGAIASGRRIAKKIIGDQ